MEYLGSCGLFKQHFNVPDFPCCELCHEDYEMGCDLIEFKIEQGFFLICCDLNNEFKKIKVE